MPKALNLPAKPALPVLARSIVLIYSTGVYFLYSYHRKPDTNGLGGE
ncbi:MAG: hypothetical protein FD166_204 [Bacteroidetes bacterium]|nr:MAG: hypothetical protein FD166_204 [Bacteroidota bacterium]